MHSATTVNQEISGRNVIQVSRRTFLRHLGLVALMCPLASCLPPSGAPAVPLLPESPVAMAPAHAELELLLWHQLSNTQWEDFSQFLSAYSDETNPVRVEVAPPIANIPLREQMLAASAAGVLPDLVLLAAIPDGADLYVKDILISPEEYIQAAYPDYDLFIEDFIENIRIANQASRSDLQLYRGELTGIPLDVQPVAALFNEDHVAAAGLDPGSRPETLDELVAWAQKLRDADDTPDQHFGFILGDKGFQPSLVFSILGAQWKEDEEAERRAAQWILDALDVEQISPRGRVQDPVRTFLAEQGSILWTTAGGLQYIEQERSFNLITAKVSQANDQLFATSAALRSLSMSNTMKDEHILAGAKVIRWISDNSSELFNRWSSLPPRRSLIEQLARDPELWNPFIDSLFQMGYNQFVFPIVADSLFTTTFDNVWELEGATAEEIAEAATAAITIWNNAFSLDKVSPQARLQPTLHPSAHTHSISFSNSPPLRNLMQENRGFFLKGCCYFCWPSWCCPDCE